jgi:hypothetical protein
VVHAEAHGTAGREEQAALFLGSGPEHDVAQTHGAEDPRLSRAKELQQDLHALLPTAKSRRAYLFLPIEDLALEALLPQALDTPLLFARVRNNSRTES